jgi:hypothetical protein
MYDSLVKRGYIPGGGLISESGLFYLNIPKNASTYFTNILADNSWLHYNLKDNARSVESFIVVLRDPVDRWISGFATYASSWLLGEGYGSDHFVEDYNDLTERLIFDNITFDDHTTPQKVYVDQLLNLNKHIEYFSLNADTIKKISRYANLDLNINEVDANVSENNYDQRQISKFIRQRIDQNVVLKTKLIEHFKDDYALIQSVKFYNDPR